MISYLSYLKFLIFTLAVVGAFSAGDRHGRAMVQLRWDQERQAQLAQLASAEAKTREAEAEANTQAMEVTNDYEAQLAAADTAADRLRGELTAPTPQPLPQAPARACERPAGASGDRLSGKSAAALVNLTVAAQRQTLQLEECQGYLRVAIATCR